MHRIGTGTNLTGYPDNPKAGYRTSGEAGNLISVRIFCSKFKCLLKNDINKEARFHESFFFTLAGAFFCL
jgi:hypothetical protein